MYDYVLTSVRERKLPPFNLHRQYLHEFVRHCTDLGEPLNHETTRPIRLDRTSNRWVEGFSGIPKPMYPSPFVIVSFVARRLSETVADPSTRQSRYHGTLLTIVWNEDGHYEKCSAGLSIYSNGTLFHQQSRLGFVDVVLPFDTAKAAQMLAMRPEWQNILANPNCRLCLCCHCETS